jgi:hypothetical protein
MLSLVKFEATLFALSALVDEMRDDNLHDEAETIADAIFFIQALRGTDLLNDDRSEPEQTDPTMETLRSLCAQMKELQLQALAIKAKAAEVRMPLDDLRLKKIPELMDSLGVKTATFAGLGRVQTAPDIYASTRAGQKPVAMQWLRDCGYGDMITETYNSSSLKALFRRMIKDQGVMPPEEIFSVTPFVRASIVKA